MISTVMGKIRGGGGVVEGHTVSSVFCGSHTVFTVAGVPVGGIVGGVIAVVVGFAVVAGAIFLYRRRRTKG